MLQPPLAVTTALYSTLLMVTTIGVPAAVGAGAGDGQILLLFDGVDHVVAGNGVHTQARQLCVDVDIALAGTGIAVRIGHRRGEG